MTNNILALVDFSHITDELVKRTTQLADLYGAKCWFMHVAAPDPDFVGYDVGPQYIRDSRATTLRNEHQKLQEFKEQCEKMGVDSEALLVQGPLFETISGEVEKLNIDLIVLGSHGRSRLYELIVGSVCEHLLKHSKVPLYILPSKK